MLFVSLQAGALVKSLLKGDPRHVMLLRGIGAECVSSVTTGKGIEIVRQTFANAEMHMQKYKCRNANVEIQMQKCTC